MRIGIVDVDNYQRLDDCFPNLVLMKLSAWHKKQGDSVEWYDQFSIGYFDRVYLSKVFSFSHDVDFNIDADEVIRGGSGYCISVGSDGKEHFDESKDFELPYEIEHIMPDYSIYYNDDIDFKIVKGKKKLTGAGKKHRDTAYGFMSRGCPRGCDFCIVKNKKGEGRCSHKVADLSEFWSGQSMIQLLDPNTFACPDWKDILTQLIDSGAEVDFNQGVDVRLLNDEKISYLKQVRVKYIHFAFDRYQDWDIVTKNLIKVKEETGWKRWVVTVYILVNFDTTIEQDIERCLFVRDVCGFTPYVMRYNKEDIPRGHIVNSLARWINSKRLCFKIKTLDEYMFLRSQGKV